MASISEMLKSLIEVYHFNMDTLSKYLGITKEEINTVAQGNVDCLPEDNVMRSLMLNKIGFLYFGVAEDKDMKLSSFLEVLISYHNLSKQTIAEMAEVKVSDIDHMLSNQIKDITIEAKYKIAVTVMELRFFLKECEIPISPPPSEDTIEDSDD
ncbi:MAG: hypothetical protein PHY47_19330 [Lachnospiraceae bacterium]|nr:hypothetical protein [Lachnospiraceae bacterium]